MTMPSGKHGILSWARRLLWRVLLAAVAVTVVPVLCLRWIPPPTSAIMLENRIAGLLRSGPRQTIHHRWTRWNAIAPVVGLAVVAAEDQKFPQHWGFDFQSIVDAVEEQGAKGRLRGASTITQQVARNLFLWQGRSYLRKALEAYFTVLLEVCWPKRRILEVYLNIAEFGEGRYGVGAASRTFFGKPPNELQASEVSLLAAVLPNPARFRVGSPSAYVRQRASWIEAQMAKLGGPAYLGTL
ncbi:MAG: monofunctional biosynthetic peptidoglycan transglycosylase [candidate division NC10 bacterium RBG_16_65_8]|nr:MAG: monofunctional biosynthetic peptidoglycan transglycosylase [candidate division NC10 bacterium RBG_16_65_8]